MNDLLLSTLVFVGSAATLGPCLAFQPLPSTTNVGPQVVDTQVWFAPNVGSLDMLDLFTEPQDWPSARSKIDVFKFYGWVFTTTTGDTLAGPNILSGFLNVGAFSLLGQWGIEIAVEGPVKPRGIFELVDGEDVLVECRSREVWVAELVDMNGAILGTASSEGIDVRYVALDEPLFKTYPYDLDGNRLPCTTDTMDEIADDVAAFISQVQSQYPSVLIGDIEPYPSMSMNLIEEWILALEARGIALPFFHLDFSEGRIEQLQNAGFNLDPVADLQQLSAFLEARNIDFGVIYFDGTWASASAGYTEELYYENSIALVRTIQSAIGVSDHTIFQSWIRHPWGPGGQMQIPINLPENDASVYSHTRLINEGLGILQSGDFDADGDVDIDDFNQFELCFTGPGGQLDLGCEAGDFDGDNDIDCDDWNQFVPAWTEPGTPPNLVQCSAAVPTVSEWGMIVMVLLMLTAGTIALGHRKGACGAARLHDEPTWQSGTERKLQMIGELKPKPLAAGVCGVVAALAGATIVEAQNLIQNPGFEQGAAAWFAFGPCTFATPTTQPMTGSRSAHLSDRSSAWNGVAQDVSGVFVPGESYQISAWARLDNATSDSIGLTIYQADDNGDNYHSIDWQTGSDSDWVQLSGNFTLNVSGSLTNLVLYLEGPAPGVNFYVDDVQAVQLPDWEDEANARIEQIRKRDARIQVVDDCGRPLVGVAVDVRQTRHRFAFGSAINGNVLTNPTYAAFFSNHFEWAVMENESKWYYNEPTQGNVTYETADGIVAFCQANNITLRGHAIVWCVDQFVQKWVQALSNPELQAALQGRFDSVVNHFNGTFVHWDVNNEMLHGSFFQNRLGPSIRPWMFQQAQATDPNAMLFVNDYNVVSGSETDPYKLHIQQLIADGAPVQGIGAQCHFWSPVVPSDVKGRLDSLAQLGLPIWCSEFDVVDPDENVRADQLEDFYRMAFSHPAVEGILMWGFWAGAHWRGPDAAIVDLDWTLNAAGQRYESLLAAWTTQAQGVSDPVTGVEFRGFHGTYEITLTPSIGAPPIQTIELAPGTGLQVFTLVVAGYGPCAGDFDGDGDVDTDDFDQFALCFTGPGGGPVSPGCDPGDFDGDGDVDCNDWGQFVPAWTEPGTPPNLVQCSAAVPTVSAWGMCVMTLVMLTTATVVLDQRRCTGDRKPKSEKYWRERACTG